MSGIKELKVSLTKNGFNKIGDVLSAVGPTQILANLDGQVNDSKIDEPQVKAMLNYDEGTGTFPAYWAQIQALGEPAVQKCVFVSVVYSHQKFIEELSKAKTGEMRGVVSRANLGDKPYTNLVAFMAKLGMAKEVKGDDERPYNLKPLFEDPSLGQFYKQIIQEKLKECGWPGANDEFTRDFYQQCEEYRFHDVLAISPNQFRDWLEGHKVEVEEPPPATFASAPATVTASLLLALATKPFVILAGATGTGKTRSARQLAEELSPSDWSKDFGTAFVPVAAGWNDARHLLGYRTPFGPKGEQYVATPLLRLLLRANHADYSHVPFFIILDEMNLSQVEMYFSSFLSLMEVSRAGGSKEPILGVPDLEILLKSRMHDALDATFAESAIQAGGLYFPSNVFVIGTVNVDDTTHTFSPKVLDRAFVLEYEPPKPSATGFAFTVPSHDEAKGNVDDLARFLVGPAVAGDATVRTDTLAALDAIFEKLGRYRFGPRTTNEIVRFVEVRNVAKAAGFVPDADAKQVIDRALLTKILPRLQGSRAMLQQTVKDLLTLATEKGYSGSVKKLEAMNRELAGGYANYFSV